MESEEIKPKEAPEVVGYKEHKVWKILFWIVLTIIIGTLIWRKVVG